MNYKLTEIQYLAIANGIREYQLDFPPVAGGRKEKTSSLIGRIITQERVMLFKENKSVKKFFASNKKSEPFKFNEIDIAFINKYISIAEQLELNRKKSNKRANNENKEKSEAAGNEENQLSYAKVKKAQKLVYKEGQRLAEIKGHLLIFCLRITGHYEEPFCRGEDALFESINEIIFEDSEIEFSIDTSRGPIDIEGFYAYRRLSFNSSFPDHITTSLLRIRVDNSSYNKKIYKYESYKMYVQNSTGSTLERQKFTEGSIFDYQGNLLFFGKVFYTDMDSTEAILSHKYPEIIYAHRHGGDIQNIRGINLGHYPFLKLPVATSVCLTKIENISEYLNFEALIEKFKLFSHFDSVDEIIREQGLVEFNTRLIQSDFSDVVSSIDITKMAAENLIGNHPISELPEAMQKMITNRIERSYSNMLTP